MTDLRMLIKVKLQYVGLHFWPKADSHVSFLAHKHRHTFFITCTKEVTHEDRQIEIITFKDEILYYLESKYTGDFGSMSCEAIAAQLLLFFNLDSCEVLEDNENGAIVYKNKATAEFPVTDTVNQYSFRVTLGELAEVGPNRPPALIE